MIKDKLMGALKTAAADYNGGMGANSAVAKAADESDLNDKQTERLVEMFNTLAAINKEKDAKDPTGSCELASKDAVAKILMKSCGSTKKASCGLSHEVDYSFYSGNPSRTNPSIEARASGWKAMMKSAAAGEESVPDELKVSQRSLYRIIESKIGCLKMAASAADDVVRNLRMEMNDEAIKIARAIESPFADPELADMFKSACSGEHAVKAVSEYSTKVAESDGGRFARLNVFGSEKVADLLKSAEIIEKDAAAIPDYERKRDAYLSKADEANREIREAVGIKSASAPALKDLFCGFRGSGRSEAPEGASGPEEEDARVCMKVAEMIRKADIPAETVAKAAECLEKDAAMPRLMVDLNNRNFDEVQTALSKVPGVDSEKKRILNVRRSIILADLLSNDPIIRDADPNVVSEAYKTMVMTSPRVSLDKAQVRSFLRSAVNSVAISPNDAKTIGDVDKLISFSNNDAGRMSALDSSIKDSNM